MDPRQQQQQQQQPPMMQQFAYPQKAPAPPPPAFQKEQYYQQRIQQQQIHHHTLPPNMQPPHGSVKPAVGPLQPLPVPNQQSQQHALSGVQILAQQQPSKDQLDQAWTEHTTPAGVKYYYNSLLQQSSYTVPEGWKQQPVVTVQSTTTTIAWTEYTDASTGKSYYSNGVTTTWEKPQQLTQELEEPQQQQQQLPSFTKKRKKTLDHTFASKDEALLAFKGLLLAKDVTPGAKWTEVVKLIAGDVRWEALQEALTNGALRQALAEYQTKRANELKTRERKERCRAKEMFTDMLSSLLPSITGFSAWNSRFAHVRDVLATDDRFHSVQEEKLRESYFVDFCEEFRKRDERNKMNHRREAQNAFLSFLTDKVESGELSYASTWNSFLSILNEEDANDARFVVTSERSDEDRSVYFADFVIELQAAEDDKRRRIREARQRAEQEQKDLFREYLAELAKKGKFLPASRWRNIEDLVSLHASYRPLLTQNGDAPRKMFEEFANEWNSLYRRERTFLNQIVYPSSKEDVLVKKETTYEEFTNALLEKAASESSGQRQTTFDIIHRAAPVSSARLFFNELSLRARGVPVPPIVRRGSALRGIDDDSSEESEGEIVEDIVAAGLM
jgi:pre-mRNA-processing factor 40